MANKELDDIIRDNAPRLRTYVKSKVGNADDAEDIVQDTFYQLLRTINIMDNPIGQVTSWLYTVAHNLIVNHGKKHREVLMPQKPNADDVDNAFMRELSDIMVAPDDDNPEILMLRKMVWEELDKALADLPAEQREAITLTEIQGLSVKDAADATGVPVGTFLSRKHYAVVHVRKRLKSLYQELVNN